MVALAAGKGDLLPVASPPDLVGALDLQQYKMLNHFHFHFPTSAIARVRGKSGLFNVFGTQLADAP